MHSRTRAGQRATPEVEPPNYFDGKESAADVIAPLGGENIVATSAIDYLNICRKIAIGLRNQYELSYRSTNSSRDGKYRHVQVKLHRPTHKAEPAPETAQFG